MPNIMMMGAGGSINAEHILMIASLRSAPIKRLLKRIEASKIVNMTYGYPQRSLVIFDNGMVVITRYEVDQLSQAIRTGKEVLYDENLSF